MFCIGSPSHSQYSDRNNFFIHAINGGVNILACVITIGSNVAITVLRILYDTCGMYVNFMLICLIYLFYFLEMR